MRTTTIPAGLITSQQAADMLGVKRSRVRQLRIEEVLESVPVDNQFLVTLDSVRKAMRRPTLKHRRKS
jgi:hypothetical protein